MRSYPHPAPWQIPVSCAVQLQLRKDPVGICLPLCLGVEGGGGRGTAEVRRACHQIAMARGASFSLGSRCSVHEGSRIRSDL